MRVLFIRPAPAEETIGLQHVMKVEPLELETLAALVPEGIDPYIVDMIMDKGTVEHWLRKIKPDILCVTGYITNIPEIKRFCKSAKEYNTEIVTICGGIHCEVCPDDLDDQFIDYRVVRNSAYSFKLLMLALLHRKEIPSGVLKPGEKPLTPPAPPDLEHYPVVPRRDLCSKHQKDYFYIFHRPVGLLKTAFGCPYQCNFCFCRKITGEQYLERPLEDVFQDLENIQVKDVYIVDDDFLVDLTRVKCFIQKLRNLTVKRRFLIYGRADFIAKHPDIIGEFAQVGLKTVIVGIESVFENELKSYSKNTTLQTNVQAINVLKKYQVDCFATVILSPEWGRDEFRKCRERLIEMGIGYVNLQPFTPLPGTDYNPDQTRLLISREDYHKWDLAHVAIKPSKLSVSEYYKEIIRMYQKILFRPQILVRYLVQYTPFMLIKMLYGTYKVWKQYMKKMKEATRA